jgi:poly(A) polymerase
VKQAATEIVRTLRQKGHSAYLVGGCVRDLLLGKEPADYDVATSATPDEVQQYFSQTYPVGAQFGVILVEIGNKDFVEVATFRSDVSYSDGRHPDAVRYTQSAKDDVQRRDFTINGLLLDPENDQVLDYVGGQMDLQNGIVRAIGNPVRRFEEDKLRMLRAVRFAARFGYKIEDETFAAIEELATEIKQVSRERVRDELLKMLTEGHARRAFELLDRTALLEIILPEITRMKGVQQPPQFHPEGDVWIHTLMLLEQLPAGASPTLALGALLHDVGKPATFRVAPDRIRFDGHVEVGEKVAAEILHRLRLSNEETAQVLALVANHMRFADVTKMKDSTLKRFFRLPRFEEHMELHRMDCTASNGNLNSYNYTRHKLTEMPAEAIRPEPLVKGNDLIEAGYEPGPRFKEILEAVEDAQLEGRLHSRHEAMQFIASEFPL